MFNVEIKLTEANESLFCFQEIQFQKFHFALIHRFPCRHRPFYRSHHYKPPLDCPHEVDEGVFDILCGLF